MADSSEGSQECLENDKAAVYDGKRFVGSTICTFCTF